MTKPTESRQLRLLISGILSAYGVDNLELEIKLCEALKKFYDSPEPRETREQILKSLERGATKHDELQVIGDKIKSRAVINPVTPAWIEFINYAWKKEKEAGQTIDKFLDWWLADEWRATHPPVKPDSWYVQWPQAFSINAPKKSTQRLPSGL